MRHQKTIEQFENFAQIIGVKKNHEGAFAVYALLIVVTTIGVFFGMSVFDVAKFGFTQYFALLNLILFFPIGIYSALYLYLTSKSKTDSSI